MSHVIHSEVVPGLSECLSQIENQLGWGPSEGWVSYDFDKLSDTISETTGVKLSNNTLKRVWGKLEYKSLPSTTTLNGLARFLGYEDWRMFLVDNGKSDIVNPQFRWKKMYSFVFLLLLAAIMCFVFFNDKLEDFSTRASDEFTFSYERITNDIPNSVVFHYNVLLDDNIDKVEIQQNWDSQKRIEVSSKDTIATSIYYTPGYFDAKLVVNNEIVKEKGLLIPSNGWLGLIEKKGQTYYFEKAAIVNEDRIEISNELFKIAKEQVKLKEELSHLYYIKDFENLTVDNFNLHVVFQNANGFNSDVCKTSDLTIYCEGQVIIIPMTLKGCISNIDLQILDKHIDGKTNDLSKFGVDNHLPISVEVKSTNGVLEIFVNDVMAYSTELSNNYSKKIFGIRYRFQGAGGIDYFNFANSHTSYLSNDDVVQ